MSENPEMNKSSQLPQKDEDEEMTEDVPKKDTGMKNFDKMMEDLEELEAEYEEDEDKEDMEDQYIDVDGDTNLEDETKKGKKALKSIEIANDSIYAFLGHDDEPVYSVAFNPAWTSKTHLQILSGGGDDSAYLWDATIPKKDEPDEIKSETIDATSQSTTTAASNNTQNADNANSKEKFNENTITTTRIQEDEKNANEKRTEESGHFKEYVNKFENHKDTIVAVQYSKSHNHEYFAVASMDSSITIYHKNELYERLEGPGAEIEWIDWHPKGLLLLCGARDNTVWLWQIHTNAKKQKSKILQVFGGHLAPVICGAFTKSGKNCYTGSEDGSLFFWDCNTGKSIHHLHGKSKLFHQSVVTACDDQYNHPIIATGGDDRKVLLINYKTGLVLKSLFDHKDTVECVEFGPNNSFCSKYLLSASLDGMLNIYDVERNGTIRSQCVHENGIVVAKWFNKQPFIATGDLNGIVSVWDARMGSPACRLRGHLETVQCLDISLDDKWIVSGSDDGSALVFPINI